VSGLPVTDVRTMEEVISRSTSRQRFNMLLMSVLPERPCVLAVIGVYGLMAYSVQQRTQEIGIRMALGAETGDVQRMVLFQGMRFRSSGRGRRHRERLRMHGLLKSFLFGVQSSDPLVFAVGPNCAQPDSIGRRLDSRAARHARDPVASLRF